MTRFPAAGTFLFLGVLILGSLLDGQARKVTVKLKAPWKSSALSPVFETSQFLADASGEAFWQFVEGWVAEPLSLKVEALSSEAIYQELVQRSLAMSSGILDEDMQKVLEVALHTRAYAPTVELYYQLFSEIENACGNTGALALVEGATSVACSVAELDSLISKRPLSNSNESTENISSSLEIFSFDHIYLSPAGRQSKTVIVYGQLGSPAFASFHNLLKTKSAEGKVRYIFRHMPPSEGFPTLLQGFGVALDIKNLEYKNIDDPVSQLGNSEAEGDEEAHEVDEDDEDGLLLEEEDIHGFLFDKLLKRKPELKKDILRFKEALSEQQEEDKLNAWDIGDIGLATLADVKEADDPLLRLQLLSQNFPVLVHRLSKIKVPDDLREEVKAAKFHLEEFKGLLFINGAEVAQAQTTSFNPYTVLKLVRDEIDNMARLRRTLGSANDVEEVMKEQRGHRHDDLQSIVKTIIESSPREQTGEASFRIDIIQGAEDLIIYLNDVEKDPQYEPLPPNIESFFAPTFSLRVIRKNLYTSIFVVDPTLTEFKTALQSHFMFQERMLPFRFGLLFSCPENKASNLEQKDSAISCWDLVRLLSYMVDQGANKAVNDFLLALSAVEGKPTVGFVISKYDALAKRKKYRKSLTLKGLEVLRQKETGASRAEKMARFVSSKSVPSNCFLMNGLLTKNLEYQGNLIQFIREEQAVVGRLIQEGKIKQESDIQAVILGDLNAYSRYHRILTESKATASWVDLSLSPHFTNESDHEEKQIPFWHHVLGKDLDHAKHISLLVFSDLSTQAGKEQAKEALNFVSCANCGDEDSVPTVLSKVRLAFLHVPSQTIVGSNGRETTFGDLFMAVNAALGDVSDKKVYQFYASLLDDVSAEGTLKAQKEMALQLAGKWLSKEVADKVKATLLSYNTSLDKTIALGAKLSRQLALGTQRAHVMVNGRLLLDEDVGTFGKQHVDGTNVVRGEDFFLLASLEEQRSTERTREIASKISGLNLAPSSPREARKISDKLMLLSNVLGFTDKSPRVAVPQVLTDSKWMKIESKSSSPVKVVAVLDPLSETAQRVTPLLRLLRDRLGLDTTVYMLPGSGYGDFPLKRFYRLVFRSPSSSPLAPSAVFRRLPMHPLLTLKVETPEPWNVQAAVAVHDLDNLRVDPKSKADLSVMAEYLLKNLLVSGHCADVTTFWSPPPSGLQLVLSREKTTSLTGEATGATGQTVTHASRYKRVDSLVMRNLGYFQLQANPGVWSLSLAKGRAREVYELVDAKGQASLSVPIIVKDFLGEPYRLEAKKRPGMEEVPLLDKEAFLRDAKSLQVEAKQQHRPSIWSSLLQYVGLKADPKLTSHDKQGETIHVFSLASGHLYERFLKIMMLSVSSHTSQPVKFWLLENFLSPSFKVSIEALAQTFGFEYELVTYKWPHWLRQQTEKQRIIWGYKILFLDVLFPLDLKKIIYVDADQVLRADLKELWELDLGGAPYAYTPFCTSREETLGFQFWRQGYWANHLRGRPYHISALYVVDLVQFRLQVAGDQLRAIYHELSADPNSLANLDQDLPNYAQHHIPIFSLPQEWLWCESWCSDDSKRRAKTIDLCNNPLHKEPKLEMAKRVVSGSLFDKSWVELDEQIRLAEEAFRRGPEWNRTEGEVYSDTARQAEITEDQSLHEDL